MAETIDRTGPDTADHQHTSSNRYILLAALAFAAVVTIYIVKTNLEPPKSEEVAATRDANSRIPDDGDGQGASAMDETAQREQFMHQIEHIQDILKKDSMNFDAWSALGNLYFDANMPQDAIVHYRKALILKPDDIHVLTDMATMLRAAGRPDTAVTVLNHVILLDSTLSQAWFNLGVIQSFDLKNQKEALFAWKKFLSLSPPSEHTEAVQKEIERLEKELGS
jgi:cytochrome c-type biogenesis protein CcmH/NrfG